MSVRLRFTVYISAWKKQRAARLLMNELKYIADFHSTIDKSNVMLAYDGVLSKDIVSAFLSRLKLDIEATNVSKMEKKRFFSIVVECIQNLSKHGQVSDLNDAHFLVLVEKDQKHLKISTGNIISIQHRNIVSGLINDINNKSQSELQELYKKGIANNILSANGEAKLGLIDIARKSSDKLMYQFNQIDDDSVFFLFQTQIQIAN